MATETMRVPNVRMVNSSRDEGGRWYVDPADSARIEYVKRELAEVQSLEPRSGWILETKGTDSGWHRWDI